MAAPPTVAEHPKPDKDYKEKPADRSAFPSPSASTVSPTSLPPATRTPTPASPSTSTATSTAPKPRRTSQHSLIAKSVLMSKIPLQQSQPSDHASGQSNGVIARPPTSAPSPTEPAFKDKDSALHNSNGDLKSLSLLSSANHQTHIRKDGVGTALSDTPAPSAPCSPRIPPLRTNSASSTPRMRPTTLDIPGLTKSKVSPDGKIAQRDVGSKLVIIMVGLPARGKSYITKKMTRYLNWLQHDTKIFNVGEKRRVAATTHGYRMSSTSLERVPSGVVGSTLPQIAAEILINGESSASATLSELNLPSPFPDGDESAQAMNGAASPSLRVVSPGPVPPTPPQEEEQNESMDQSASFFDPTNKRAAQIREQCAMETLDDLLDYILIGNGSVGIFDATNSTLGRRKQIMEKIRERAGPELNVLFVESVCQDQTLLESNMRLKLSGPDYDGKDPVAALEDFKKRVAIYEKNYVPIGDYEEEHNMPYVKMIDVGRKMVSHQVRGFLAGQAVYYLLNFNLSPRMIWLTRHGESLDNVAGRIGGDSDLSENGRRYSKAMTHFIDRQRKEWAIHQADKVANTHFPPAPGDHTPPNPHYGVETEDKNFCVWTSMLKRSVQTGEYFCEDNYDVKQMRMLDELNAGIMEGLTYAEIHSKHEEEFLRRRADKLAYRYPGPGGEGYLDVINRIRPVIVELERMTDHCLLVTHRSVARVLLAYFQGLKREDVADLDCPLGILYQMEPKPYGVEFKAWRYNSETDDFEHLPDYKLRRAPYLQ